ncbi:MAG: APC family permease [Candidatus Lokiarchaeota archaeon]|nr:APC family permease [Candidatus Lokiarchaeota archaeon]
MNDTMMKFFGKNEQFRYTYGAERRSEKEIIKGTLVLTNYRLLFFKYIKPLESEDLYLVDSIFFDEIFKVLIDRKENWIMVNTINYRPSINSPAEFVSLLEKVISEQPKEKLDLKSVDGIKKYTNTERFFDFMSSVFTIPIVVLAIVGLSFYIFEITVALILAFALCVCGIVFSAFLMFDKRDYPYYILVNQDLKIEDDRRAVVLGLSIAGVVLNVGASILVGSSYLTFDFTIFTADIWSLLRFIGMLIGMIGFIFSIAVGFEMSNVYVREPKWASHKDNALNVQNVEKFNKTMCTLVIVFLALGFGFFTLFQAQAIWGNFIPYVNNFIWNGVAIIIRLVALVLGLCAFGFLAIRAGLFFFSFLFGAATRIVTQIGDISKSSWYKLKEKFKVESEKLKERSRRLTDNIKESFLNDFGDNRKSVTEIQPAIESETIDIETEKDVISTSVGIREETTEMETSGKVEVTRGGIIKGGKYIYKVKVVNNSNSVITDIKILITSFPSDSMVLLEEEVQKRNKIGPRGDLVAVTFSFKPTTDCISGRITSITTYIDAKGESQQIMVAPHEVKMVCGLLQPASVNTEEFEKITKGLLEFTKSGEDIEVPFNVKMLYEKILLLLPEDNFQIVSNELIEVGKNYVGIIKGYAEGKYTKNKVGLKLTITGDKELPQSSAKIEAYTQDKNMLVPILSEISESLKIMKCNQCGASLDETQIKRLTEGKVITCNFCGESISPKI